MASVSIHWQKVSDSGEFLCQGYQDGRKVFDYTFRSHSFAGLVGMIAHDMKHTEHRIGFSVQEERALKVLPNSQDYKIRSIRLAERIMGGDKVILRSK